MVELLTNNKNESFKSICDSIEEGKKIDFYVMPIETKMRVNDPIVLSYIKNDEIKFVKVKSNEYGENHIFMPGQKITVFNNNKVQIVNSNIPKWEKAVKYNNTIFCYAQKIIIIDSINRDVAIKLGNEFEKNNALTFRVVINGASGDSLYTIGENDNTVRCRDSRADLEYIDLYTALTNALVLAHEGKNVVFILDSILSLVISLRHVFPKSRLLTGNIPNDALSLIKNLFSLGGGYNGGTLTMVCIYNSRSNIGDLKNAIFDELYDSFNARIYLSKETNVFNQPKIKSMSNIKPVIEYPYVKIFGKKIHY